MLENGYNGSTVEAREAGEDRQNKRPDPTVVGILLRGEIYCICGRLRCPSPVTSDADTMDMNASRWVSVREFHIYSGG